MMRVAYSLMCSPLAKWCGFLKSTRRPFFRTTHHRWRTPHAFLGEAFHRFPRRYLRSVARAQCRLDTLEQAANGCLGARETTGCCRWPKPIAQSAPQFEGRRRLRRQGNGRCIPNWYALRRRSASSSKLGFDLPISVQPCIGPTLVWSVAYSGQRTIVAKITTALLIFRPLTLLV